MHNPPGLSGEPAFSPVQSFHAVLYPTDVTFIIPLLQAESMAKCPSSPLTTPFTKAESCLFKSTTLAKAKGSPFSSTIFPFISCAIIGVIAEKHRNVISVLLFIVSIFYFAGAKVRKNVRKASGCIEFFERKWWIISSRLFLVYLCSVWTAYELDMNRNFDRNLCKNLEHINKYRIFVAKWK